MSLSLPGLDQAQDHPYPELAQGVDVLGLEECIIVAVHQALPVDHSGIVHQDGDVTHLWVRGATGPLGQPSPVACNCRGRTCGLGQPHRLSEHRP